MSFSSISSDTVLQARFTAFGQTAN